MKNQYFRLVYKRKNLTIKKKKYGYQKRRIQLSKKKIYIIISKKKIYFFIIKDYFHIYYSLN